MIVCNLFIKRSTKNIAYSIKLMGIFNSKYQKLIKSVFASFLHLLMTRFEKEAKLVSNVGNIPSRGFRPFEFLPEFF